VKLLHVSDTHIGFAAYARVTQDGLNQREADLFDAFRRVIDLAIAERVDVVLHSGDLFDSVRPTNRALTFVMGELVRLHAASIPFVVISGNHEAPRLRETGAVLRLLDFIPGVRAVYKGAYERVRIGELAIHCVPHAASNEALREQLALAVPDASARWNVATLHAGVLGVGDFRTGEFNEQVVPQNELPQGMDHVALGHYHRATEVAPGVWYAGSTERITFREVGETKSVCLVDLARGTVETRALPTRPMIDLPALSCAGMQEADIAPALYGRLGEARLDGAGRDDGSSASSPAGCGAIARLRVTALPAHVYAALDFERVKKLTAGALHFDLQPEIVRATADGRQATPTLGALGDEFEAFLDQRALQGADRDGLAREARALLSEAGAP
jgi:hypothetical protein